MLIALAISMRPWLASVSPLTDVGDGVVIMPPMYRKRLLETVSAVPSASQFQGVGVSEKTVPRPCAPPVKVVP